MGGFCTQIEWGRVGQGGLGALWRRLHHDIEHPTLEWALHPALAQSLDHLLHVFLDDRRRVVPPQPDTRPPLLVASHAQADPGRRPTGAVLVWDLLTDARSGRVTTFSQSLLAAWGYGQRQLAEGGTPFLLCEATVFPLFQREYAELVRGRCILYF